jgi:hypothetical protein
MQGGRKVLEGFQGEYRAMTKSVVEGLYEGLLVRARERENGGCKRNEEGSEISVASFY